MKKRPDFKEYEKEIYNLWEKKGFFKPEVNPEGKPFCILLPPPNANADLHVGHAMYVVEDLLIRWHRMRGNQALWLPGTDHAGFETQYVYEKHLTEKGQSRFDFDRETLYEDIYDFVRENSGVIQHQLRQLGFSLDWSRETFTLDDGVVDRVYQTFQQMHEDGLVYRDNYIVNYCPHFGTTFADLEVKYREEQSSLWYLRYPLVDVGKTGDTESVVVATTRPETMLGDTAVAVHPKDERYRELVGRSLILPLVGREIPIIADEEVDPEFGTGAVKVTPAHDATDFEIGRRHELEVVPVIDFTGRLNDQAGEYQGMSVGVARERIVQDLQKEGFLDRVEENYQHRVMVSYKGDHPIEPMVMPNWFVSAAKLAEPAIGAAKGKEVEFIPERFEKEFYRWMENIRPWPISRQIVWGIRIPAWYSVDENPDIQVTFLDTQGEVVNGRVDGLLEEYSLGEITAGLQSLIAPIGAKYVIGVEKPGPRYLQETDVFDTWYSSGQWPLVTLGYPESEDFKTFYPTDVLDTMWDILFFWVARMIMFGLYLTGEVPFRYVYLHSMVTDEQGAKMSKSKGNVVNPLEVVEEFGADALRMSLLVGSAPGNPVALSMKKVKGYRNFVTKIWNASRFVLSHLKKFDGELQVEDHDLAEMDREIVARFAELRGEVDEHLEKFQFSLAGEKIYDFFWHDYCDEYIERTKDRVYGEDSREREAAVAVLVRVLMNCLKLLHPYMPFVTEEIYQKFLAAGLEGPEYCEGLIVSPWPD